MVNYIISMRFYFFILFFLEIGLGECLISQTREIVPDLIAQTDYEIGTSYAKKTVGADL